MDTNPGEIKMIIGILLIMSYNKVPNISDYWSEKYVSFGNISIKTAMSRKCFQVLFSKLYFINPEQPADVSKTHYLDEIIEYLKGRFLYIKADSQHQNIEDLP